MVSTTMTPSCSALCASIGGPATSPMAQIPGTLVRPWSSTTIAPRSIFTPSFSSPRFSVLQTTPTPRSAHRRRHRPCCLLELDMCDDAGLGLVDLGYLRLGHEP